MHTHTHTHILLDVLNEITNSNTLKLLLNLKKYPYSFIIYVKYIAMLSRFSEWLKQCYMYLVTISRLSII